MGKFNLAVVLSFWVVLASVGASASSDFNDQILTEDLFQSKIEVKDKPLLATVQVRLIDHNTRFQEIKLKRMLSSIEAIYSQCPSLALNVQVKDRISVSSSRVQESLIDFSGSFPTLNPEFFKFFGKFAVTRPTRTVDIHFVDFFRSQSRIQFERSGKIGFKAFGQAYNRFSLDERYIDPRINPSQRPSELAGDSILISTKTVEFAENQVGYVLLNPADIEGGFKKIWQGRRSSLLAHELGHLLIEGNRPGKEFKDHFCPGQGAPCSKDQLMVAGGYVDNAYRDPIATDKIIGYSPLPKIEQEQCDELIRHPLVRLEPNSPSKRGSANTLLKGERPIVLSKVGLWTEDGRVSESDLIETARNWEDIGNQKWNSNRAEENQEVQIVFKFEVFQDVRSIPSGFHRIEVRKTQPTSSGNYSAYVQQQNSASGPHEGVFPIDGSPKTIAHELGHLLNLEDEYRYYGKSTKQNRNLEANGLSLIVADESTKGGITLLSYGTKKGQSGIMGQHRENILPHYIEEIINSLDFE